MAYRIVRDDSDDDFSIERRFYTVDTIRKAALQKFPYAIQLLPHPDDIRYHIQSVMPTESHYTFGITLGHVLEAGQVKAVSAVMEWTGEVGVYLTDEGKKISRPSRSNIEFLPPWVYLKRDETRPRFKEVCALSAWYLMIHNCGTIKPVTYFAPCLSHKFVDLHRAILMVGDGVMKAEEIEEDKLSDEDFQRLCIDSANIHKEQDSESEDDTEEEGGAEEDESQEKESHEKGPPKKVLAEEKSEETDTGIVDYEHESAAGAARTMTQAELFNNLLGLADPAKRKEAEYLARCWKKYYGD